MATRNFVPRANSEGSIGTANKHWRDGHFDDLHVGGVAVGPYAGLMAASAPVYYQRESAPVAVGKTSIKIKPTWININGNGYVLDSNVTLDITQTASWDDNSYTAAANRAGRDFYVYACIPDSGTTPDIILSANSTVPGDYTAANSRKIGGFHCLCADVGTLADNALTGYVTGDILPASVWDLEHRPIAEPEGMVYHAGLDLWVDIYLASYTGSYSNTPEDLKLVSVYHGVCADGTSAEKFHCLKFEQVFARQKKRLLYHREFVAISIGSNQSTNVLGGADVNITGGFKDTANRRMISSIGCEDCCGNLWQWGADVGYATTGSSSWKNCYDANDKYVAGQQYGDIYRPIFGGGAGNGVNCGSRASGWNDVSLYLNWAIGARGASEPLHRST